MGRSNASRAPVANRVAALAKHRGTEADEEREQSADSLTAIRIGVIVTAIVATVAAARFAQPLLVPVLAGVLLSYTLQPLVTLLERARIPRIAGAAIVITVLVALVSGVVYAIRDDVSGAIAELPMAARRATAMLARQPPGPMSNVKAAAAELDRAAAAATGKPAAAADTAHTGVAAQFQTFVDQQSATALGVFSEIFVALLLAFFLLSAGDTFRRKVAKLAGESLARRRVTVEMLDEIHAQIQAYMATLLIANCLIALATWAALTLLGVANAGLWAVVTGVLHIIPYAGTLIAATAIGAAAFVGSGSIGVAFVAMATIAGIAAVVGMGLATWLQGRATRMNPVAIFIGVLFFGWLWGGWGLLLGVPILAVMKSVADRVEALHPLSELLSL